jgi:hypothetical protein
MQHGLAAPLVSVVMGMYVGHFDFAQRLHVPS